MKSKYLERMATQTALRQGELYKPDAKMYFEAPSKGPAFQEGPFTLHIPKTVQFAPYILTFYRLAEHYNRVFIADQIGVRNYREELKLTFAPRQFAQAFSGFYHPREMAKQISLFVAKEDDTSRAVVSQISTLTDQFFCVRYIVETCLNSNSRMLVSDEKEMSRLAEIIPKRYKHPSSKKGIRALTFEEVTYHPYEDELPHRFKPDNMRFIVLKGFQWKDRFRFDALEMAVNERPLSLTQVERAGFNRHPPFAPVFCHESLWKYFGQEVMINYALWNIPENIVRERFSDFSVIIRGLRILKGQKIE